MHTTGRRRRRRHSAQFKAEAVAACRQEGVSVAAVALSRGVNANLLRRWVVEAERDGTVGSTAIVKALPRPIELASFVPVPMKTASAAEGGIRIEVRRGTTVVTVQWPTTAARQCASLLRKLLR